MRILLAYSGGLDTSWLTARFAAEGHEVTTLFVDCGGLDDAARRALAARAAALGAAVHRTVDARQELWDRVLRWLLAGNVLRGGAYPLCAAAERGVQAAVLAREAARGGYDAVAHGCTAAGNDQVRFDAALAVLAPGLPVLAPVRDEAPRRAEQEAWLRRRGLPVPPAGGRYSVNTGLWGCTIGGGELADSLGPLPEDAWPWTRGGGGSGEIRVAFRRGVPAALDGTAMDPVALVEALNRRGAALGLGRGYHLGDTILGIKGRIAFEAPAALLLIHAHRELEKLVLTEEQRFWKDHLGEVYGRFIHRGLLLEPFLRDLEALFASSQERVTGTVRIEARGGAFQAVSVTSPHSLLHASAAAYGEQPDTAWEPGAGAALARILAEPGRLHARAGAPA